MHRVLVSGWRTGSFTGGLAPAVQGLLAGETSVMFLRPLPTVAGEVRGGKRSGAARRVAAGEASGDPHVAEQGPQMAAAHGTAFAPKGTSPEITAKLHAMLLQVMARPDQVSSQRRRRRGAHQRVAPAVHRVLRAETERAGRVVGVSATPQ
jgi:tripartite-type tricarboxylate transporter receptor subunit TctC